MIRKIIVRMPNWIGDLVMATPVLTDLRKHFPNTEITAMCKTPLCDLFKQDPRIDELFCFSRLNNDFSRRQEERDIIGKLRTGNYDIGILLTNSFSSAWWFWQGNVRQRIGYRGHFRSLLLTEGLSRPNETVHQTLYYKKLLEPLGIHPSQTNPILYVSDQEVAASKEILVQRGYSLGKPLIGINPGAAYGSAKCWPPERFRELAVRLLEKDPESTILFFGDGTTKELIQMICQGLPKQVINLAGVTSLTELCALIKDCDVVVSNDSGPMHIAAALQTPVVALFGSTDDQATGPFGQEEGVINKRANCSPCMKRTCPIDFRCMRGIAVDEVLQKTLQRKRVRV